MHALVILLLAASCADRGVGAADAGSDAESCDEGEMRCTGAVFQVCAGGVWGDAKTCDKRLVCDLLLGCVECNPRTRRCDGNQVVECGPYGEWGGVIATCDSNANEVCAGGACGAACTPDSTGSMGCEYWPTVTTNANLDVEGGGLDFAVAVANPNPVTVAVTVERAGEPVATVKVEPQGVEAIRLPWVTSLLRGPADPKGYFLPQSAHVQGGAYRLFANGPISAYQFNPLQFQSGSAYSFTNDASLLLPQNRLGAEYLVIARPTFSLDGYSIPGFFSVVGTQDGTTVTIRFSTGTEDGPGLDAYAAGEEASFDLGRGDVIQFVSAREFGPAECDETGAGVACVGGPAYDLTGTRVVADRPIAVFAGHDCSFVPFDRWACDHLEEQMTPLETWGASVVAVSTAPLVAGEPNMWKLVSGSDDNLVRFDPEVVPDATLDAGEYVEFVHEGAFRVESAGGQRIALAQFMVGEDYDGLGEPPDVGDPSMALVVHFEQFRTAYYFLTPETYTLGWINVIAPLGVSPTVDGDTLDDLTAIGDTGFGYVRAGVNPGAHIIENPEPFAVMVSGVASYTSYLYAAGTDLVPVPID